VLTQVAGTLVARAETALVPITTAVQTQIMDQSTPTVIITPIVPTPEAIAVIETVTSAAPTPSPTIYVDNSKLPPPPPPPPLPPEYQDTPWVITFTPALVTAVPSTRIAPSGEGFHIDGVNLRSCGGMSVLSYQITNTGSLPLSSLSLAIEDQTTGHLVYANPGSEAPFFANDRRCLEGGIDLLEPGHALFIGGRLWEAGLPGHTLSADIQLCTHPGLGGSCYRQTVAFVVP
jgi:hypothetical protein